jgi:RimJ/RimL family protein N-acetyltransferase
VDDDSSADAPLLGRAPARPPVRTSLAGRFVRLEPLDPVRHLDDLFAAAADPAIWAWLGYGPFADRPALQVWLEDRAHSVDPLFFAVRDLRDGRAKGMCAWLRLDPAMAVIEVGHIWYGPELQRTPATTEAMLLLFRHAFEERRYRRLEWKCNAENQRSRNAALRLGFTFEGVFRQHMITKGRNRDTAWFSLLDDEWPAIGAAMSRWLAPANFTPDGRQVSKLADLIAAARQG